MGLVGLMETPQGLELVLAHGGLEELVELIRTNGEDLPVMARVLAAMSKMCRDEDAVQRLKDLGVLPL